VQPGTDATRDAGSSAGGSVKGGLQPLLSRALRPHAATGGLGAERSATTGTCRTGTGARHCARSRQGTSVGTTMCHRTHAGRMETIARQCAETGCLLGARWCGAGTATTGTQSQGTDARTDAKLNAGTSALVERIMQARARQSVGTDCELATRSATTATRGTRTVAAQRALWRRDGRAVCLGAGGRGAAQLVGMEFALATSSAMMGIGNGTMGARTTAEKSAGSLAREGRTGAQRTRARGRVGTG
jgi:hypothetical protein